MENRSSAYLKPHWPFTIGSGLVSQLVGGVGEEEKEEEEEEEAEQQPFL